MHVFIFFHGWVVPYAADYDVNCTLPAVIQWNPLPHVIISTGLDSDDYSDQGQSHMPIHVANFPAKGIFYSYFYVGTVNGHDFWTMYEHERGRERECWIQREMYAR